jgi:RNA polymerase sigma factor (sigma-70 family)
MATQQDQRISDAIRRERSRLRSFIRRRVADTEDAEDVLQDVFAELVEAERLMRPIDEIGAWLYSVARNRITDLFRKKRPEPLPEMHGVGDESEALSLEDLLPSRDGGPQAAYARTVLLDALDAALDALPEEQREAFVAHVWEGKTFKELAAKTGVGVNTLLWRKHAAVLHLRERLQSIYEVPPIFGWSAVGFWQALGLLLLCRILVGGFHGGPNSHSDWRHRMIHRWERLTPEEREKLRAAMRAHGCGPEAAEGQSRA